MSPSFYHDYRPMIQAQAIRDRFGRTLYHQCHAEYMGGDAMLGCRAATSEGAYWSLCDFIDGELERRAKAGMGSVDETGPA